MKRLALLSIVFLNLTFLSRGQEDNSVLAEWLNQENQGIEALVLYPDSVIEAILEVSVYPEALARIEGFQNKTQEAFVEILSPFNQEIQNQFYELARYPGLIATIGVQERLSRAQLKEVSNEYPEEIRPIILEFGRKRHHELFDIYQLETKADEAFRKIISAYPERVEDDFEMLLGMPDVLDVLMEHFQTTVLIGAEYRLNPEEVLIQIRAKREEVRVNQALELEEWKKSLAENPEAQGQLEAAVEDFANENQLPPPTYRSGDSEDRGPVRVIHHYHYPYWFGYPAWYRYPYWYPMSYWDNWGFYYGLRGGIVFYDMPSWYFMQWYFTNSYHHYYYPHLTHIYIRHYERYPQSAHNSTRIVRDWVTRSRNVNGQNWLRNDENRINRIKNYGLREANRQIDRPNVRPNRNLEEPYNLERNVRKNVPVYSRPSSRSNNTINQSTRINRPNRPLQSPRNNSRATEYHKRTWERATPIRKRPAMKPAPRNNVQINKPINRKPTKRN